MAEIIDSGYDTINNYDWYRYDDGRIRKYNQESNVIVFIGEANGNNIFNSMNFNVTIISGASDDSIYNDCGETISINSGAGNDSIHDYHGNYVTINAGAGNDFISLYSSENILIKYSGGNDIIYCFDDDTLQIASGKVSSVMKFLDSNNLCVAVGNDTIKLAGVGEDSINLVDANGKNIDYTLHIIGTEESDSIYSGYGAKKFIHGEAGDDTVENFYSYVTIDGGKGNDSIENSGDKVSILGGENDDYIWNGQSDYYPTKGDKTSIDAGACNDTVINYGASVSINGGADNDSITNSGDKVTINAGTGNNIIRNGNYEGHTKTTTMRGGVTAEKFIVDESLKGGSNVTIIAGDNDDKIYNFGGSKVSINAGAGKNLVSVHGGNNISIESGEGDDSIYNFSGSKVSINAGDGKNIVNVGNGSNIIVKGGQHTDVIVAENVSYATIDAGAENNFVSIGSNGRFVTVDGGKDSDVVLNAGKKNTLNGAGGNDYIRNEGDGAIIFGGDDGDIIENYGNSTFIQGDKGGGKNSSNVGDYISTDKGNKVTIDAGESDDTITAFNDVNASIMGGKGNDSISVSRIPAEELNKISNNGLSHVFWFLWDALTPFPSLEGLLEDDGWKDYANWASTASKLSLYLSEQKLKQEIGEDLAKKSVQKISTFLSAVSGALDLIKFGIYINKLSKSSTVNGGVGDDTIVSDGFAPRVFEYKTGDGNDVIHRFSVDSTLKSVLSELNDDKYLSTIHITKGKVKNITLDNVKIDSSDVMINVDKGSIRLVQGDDKKFKIRESNGTTTTLAYKCDPDRADTICSIFGGSKSETIKDTISGEVYRNALYGEGGDDLLIGNVKDDTLDGGSGSDILRGGKGHDVLYSGDGKKNVLEGGVGNDTIYSEMTAKDFNSPAVTIQSTPERTMIISLLKVINIIRESAEISMFLIQTAMSPLMQVQEMTQSRI